MVIHYKVNFIERHKWPVLSRLDFIDRQSDCMNVSTDGKLDALQMRLVETLSAAVSSTPFRIMSLLKGQ
jgi:hypothetical protein